MEISKFKIFKIFSDPDPVTTIFQIFTSTEIYCCNLLVALQIVCLRAQFSEKYTLIEVSRLKVAQKNLEAIHSQMADRSAEKIEYFLLPNW